MLEFGKAYAEGLILPLQNQIDGINTLLASDNINLDTIQEIVDAIENVEAYLATILVNDLTTGGVTKALTAEMGKVLENTKVALSSVQNNLNIDGTGKKIATVDAVNNGLIQIGGFQGQICIQKCCCRL